MRKFVALGQAALNRGFGPVPSPLIRNLHRFPLSSVNAPGGLGITKEARIMATDTVIGNARNIGGTLEEGLGKATDNASLQRSGIADQIGGQVQKTFGVAKDAAVPLANQAKQFARERPWATAALLGTIGLALINTLRGKTVK